LPLPLSPTTDSISDSLMSKDTLSTALTTDFLFQTVPVSFVN